MNSRARSRDTVRSVPAASLSRTFAEDKLTYAVEKWKSYSVDYTIVQLEQMLDPRRFVRIHRSTLINTAWIKEVTNLPGGGLNASRIRSSGASGDRESTRPGA